MNNQIVIVDLELDIKIIIIITLYRSFQPPGNVSSSTLKNLRIIERNIVPDTVILDDFNLDAVMQNCIDYPHKLLYRDLNLLIANASLEQLVHFPTWSHNVKNVLKQLTLDQVYTNNQLISTDCTPINTLFGDHLLIRVDLNVSK